MKKFHKLFYSSLALILVIATFFSLSGLINPNKQAFAQTTQTLGGYGWSSNIGWMSLSGPITGGGTYGVSIDGSGYLNGYSWSSNVGWTQFGGWDTQIMPRGTGTTKDNVKLSGSSFSGWARVVVAESGWDGWISFSGKASDNSLYGVTVSNTPVPGNPGAFYLTGYAWGGDVVGWIDMSQVYIGGSAVVPPNPSLTINLVAGTGCSYDAILTWNVESGATYTLKRTLPAPPKTIPVGSGTATDSGLTPNTSYKYVLSASNSAGTTTVSSSTTTPASCPANTNPPIIGSFTAVPPAVLSGGSCSLTWAGIQNISIPPDTCTITGPNMNYSLATSTDGSTPSPAITSSSRYTITCTNLVGSASKQTSCNLKPAFDEF